MEESAFWISVYAAIVATLALGWKVMEFKLSGRRLMLDADFNQTLVDTEPPTPSGDRGVPIEWCSFEVTLRSVGRQSLTVESCRIEFRAHDGPHIDIEQSGRSGDQDVESSWPMRLEGGESRVVTAWQAAETVPTSGAEFRACAVLGTGKCVVSPWRQIHRPLPAPGDDERQG
ncbi:MAG: hypothetical protein R2878_03085 [Thermoleophilia bacterium]